MEETKANYSWIIHLSTWIYDLQMILFCYDTYNHISDTCEED